MVDTLERLNKAAKRQQAEEDSAEKISQAISHLIMSQHPDYVFFAHLVIGADIVPDWDIPTAATNGVVIKYNPEFIAGLTDPECLGVMVHEGSHDGFSHHARISEMGDIDLGRANAAADLAINPIIESSGLTLPDGALFPGKGDHRDIDPSQEYSLEALYHMLPDNPPGRSGYGTDDGGCGGVEPLPDGVDPAQIDQQKRINVARAEQQAAQRGELSSALSRVVQTIVNPRISARELLRRFASNVTSGRDDYSWSRPNRRFISQGLYLPGVIGNQTGEIVIMIDVSGSIGDDDLAEMAADLTAICEVNPTQLTIYYHHTHVCRVQVWRPGDGDCKLETPETGGTSHIDVFERAAKESPNALAIVAFTDLYSTFPEAPPACPIIWVVSGNSSPSVPYGEIAEVV